MITSYSGAKEVLELSLGANLEAVARISRTVVNSKGGRCLSLLLMLLGFRSLEDENPGFCRLRGNGYLSKMKLRRTYSGKCLSFFCCQKRFDGNKRVMHRLLFCLSSYSPSMTTAHRRIPQWPKVCY